MDNLKPSTVRPGFMVALRTKIEGNVSYKKETLLDDVLPDGVGRKRWETERTTLDTAEHDEAVEVRGKCRSIIAAKCARTDLGCMLCREENAETLDSAIGAARKLADEFNAKAKFTRVSLGIVVGRILDNKVENVRAINENVRSLMRDMEAGVKKLDAEAIRKAAVEAKSISQMLTPDAERSVKNAIDQARKVARKLVAYGEVAAREIDKQALAALLYARTTLVDLDPQGDIGEVDGESRAFDLNPPRTTQELEDAVTVSGVPTVGSFEL